MHRIRVQVADEDTQRHYAKPGVPRTLEAVHARLRASTLLLQTDSERLQMRRRPVCLLVTRSDRSSQPGALLARDEAGAAVGMLQGWQPGAVVDDDGSERTSALLTYLAVEPAHQRTGVGSSLIAEFCARSSAAGAEFVVLQIGPATGERADALKAFYKTNGFVVHGPGFRRELRSGSSPRGSDRPPPHQAKQT